MTIAITAVPSERPHDGKRRLPHYWRRRKFFIFLPALALNFCSQPNGGCILSLLQSGVPMIRSYSHGERLLEIDNRHVADCGAPPDFDASSCYLSYFENTYGEQWVFCGDVSTRDTEDGFGKGPHLAYLWGGDIEWANRLEMSWSNPIPQMMFNEPEKTWLIACWMAFACDKRPSEVVDQWNNHGRHIAEEVRERLAELKSGRRE